jgi:hypothetical protein
MKSFARMLTSALLAVHSLGQQPAERTVPAGA